jgi:hypothetical protein
MAKPKSAVTPIKTVRSYAEGLNRTERRIRKLIAALGKDPDKGHPLELTDQYLRLGKEAREMAMFDIRLRRELAELQDVEYRVMNDEVLEKLLTGEIRRRGYRNVREIRESIRDRLTAAGLGPELVDGILPPVPEMPQRTTLSAKLSGSYRRIEADLDAARADVDEALASSEEGAEGTGEEDQGTEAEGPSDEAGA